MARRDSVYIGRVHRERPTTIPSHPHAVAGKVIRPAVEHDIPAILAFERIPEFHTLVGKWSHEEHLRRLVDPDIRYRMVLDAEGGDAGFAILRGVQSPHANIELKRFVIGAPGAGLGQRALHAIMAYAFRDMHAHRLWLDVFTTNARALHVYRKAGFHQEGILREAIYRDGEFHSLFLCSILEKEYLSQRVP